MSLRTWLARLRPRAAGSIGVPDPNTFLVHPWLKEAGVWVTAETALQVSAVYACGRLIVDSLAPAPIVVQELQQNGQKRALPDDPVGWMLEHGADVNVLPDAPTAQAIEEALFWSALSDDGNGYAEIQFDRAGNPVALWPIESWRVTPVRIEVEPGRREFRYRVDQPMGGQAYVEPFRIFHLRGPSLRGFLGDSIIARAAKAVGIAQASQVFSAAYFANGTVVSGLLTSDKMITPAQAKEARERWEREHGQGPSAAHGISVMGQGLKYQPVNHDAKQSQLVESRRFQVQEIARFFGVPTTLLADNEAWTNLSELYLGFYRNALLPWKERFDAEATRKLFPRRKPWRVVSHDLTAIVMGSFKDQVDALRNAVNAGIWTRNEAREIFGKNSLGSDGDLVTIETMVKPMDEERAKLKYADLKAKPELYQYHIEQGLVTRNEARERLDLPPIEGGDEFTVPTQVKVDDNQAEIQQDAGDQSGNDPGAEPDEAPDNQPPPVNTRPHISARDAVVAMCVDAFTRHAKRIRDGRPRSAEGLALDCAAAWALAKSAFPGDAESVDLAPFADALEQGEPPDKAAGRFVDSFWAESA